MKKIIAAAIAVMTISSVNAFAYDLSGVTVNKTLEEAVTIALQDAGVSKTDATIKKQKLDREDGIYVYDIEFYADTTEYEYEINANTGAVYDKDVEVKKSRKSNTKTSDIQTTYDESSLIGIEKARSIAFEKAGVTGTVTKEKLKSRKAVYEIKFYTDTANYEFEINAISGTVEKVDYELINR